MSEEAVKSFPHYYDEAQKCKNEEYISAIEDKIKQEIENWNALALNMDKGIESVPWYADEIEIAEWPTMELPGYWSQTHLKNTNGIVWLRRNISLPKECSVEEFHLKLGRIVNADSVYKKTTHWFNQSSICHS